MTDIPNQLPRKDEVLEKIVDMARSRLDGTRLTELLHGSRWRPTTAHVKAAFGDLGKKELKFRVAASGYPGADDGEWLYDMLWYSVDEDGCLARIAMALESEFKPGGSVLNAASVDGDFEKLVQARAEIRVWFALLPNPDQARTHLENCKRLASRFAGASPGDQYVFIIYDWTNKSTAVETFTVGG